MKRTWQWTVTAAAVAVLLAAGTPVLAQRTGVRGGGRVVGGVVGRPGGFFGGPRVVAGGFTRFPGAGFGRFGGAGFGRFGGLGFGGFSRRGFVGGGTFVGGPFLGSRFRPSPLIYPSVFGLYTPWYADSYYFPMHYYPDYAPSAYPYGYDGPEADYSDGANHSDHFTPLYAVLYSASVTTVTLSTAADSAVRLDVIVPDTAEVWIEGVAMKQKGGVRKFVSPPLVPGGKYAYEVRARWTQDGRPIDQVHEVTVRAGELVRVDFLKPPDLLASDSDTPTRPGPLNELGVSALARAVR
jgi:uncharacterized protein (TIGR03000 family)